METKTTGLLRLNLGLAQDFARPAILIHFFAKMNEAGYTLLMRYEKDIGTYIGEIGEFRKSNIEVSQATFKPVDVFYVREAMELFIKWFNESLQKKIYDYVTLAAMAHVWFETIHPFRDGNGRVGRILLSYVLIGQGLVNVAIKGVSKNERNKYYDILEQADYCFEEIHCSIEARQKITVSDVNKKIDFADFDPFRAILIKLLYEAVSKIESGRTTNLDKDAILSLREIAGIYSASFIFAKK